MVLVGGDVHDYISELAPAIEGSGRGRKVCTIVSTNKSIAIAALLDTVYVLLALLEGDVHVAVDGLKFACFFISLAR